MKINKLFWFATALCFYCFTANAQTNATWANVPVAGDSSDVLQKMVTDAAGNIYVSSTFRLTADADPGAGVQNFTSNGGPDIMLSKFNPNGTLAWAKTMGTAGTDVLVDMAVDASGNIVVVGYFGGGGANLQMDFNFGTGTNILTSMGSKDGFVAKYDGNGTLSWAFNIGSQGVNNTLEDEVTAVDVDASGNVYVTGRWSGTADFDPSGAVNNQTSITTFLGSPFNAFVAKYTANGAFDWFDANFGENLGYTDIKISSLGNVFLTGAFAGTNIDVAVGDSTAIFTYNNQQTIFLTKYDAAFNLLWVRVGGFPIYPREIAVDASENLYGSGLYTGGGDFDFGTTVNILGGYGNFDIYLFKYNAAGDYAWAKFWGSADADATRGLALTPMGDILLSGNFKNIMDINPSPSTYSGVTSAGDSDIFVARLDNNGNYISGFTFGGTSYEEDKSLVALNNDEFLFAGSFSSPSLDVDPTANTLTLNLEGVTDPFLVKYNACTAPLGISATATNISCPAANDGVIDLTVTGNASFVWSNTATTQDISGLSAGAYSVTITNNTAGCNQVFTDDFTIIEPAAFASGINATDESVCNANDGTVSTNVTGGTAPYAYLWNTGGTTANINNLASGTYSLTVTDANGCQYTDTDIVSCLSGLNDVKNVQWAAYPNPAQNSLYVNADLTGTFRLSLYNNIGQMVYTTKTPHTLTEIPVAELPAGTYFLRLDTDNHQAVKAIVVE